MSLLIRSFRSVFAWVRRLDDRDFALLRPIPSLWKRRLLRGCFRLAGPLLARKPIAADGLRFYVPAALAYSYLLQDHEPATQEVFRSYLKPGMRMVDVGANIGFLSVLAARLVAPGGRVYAIEPGERNLDYLRRNLELNGADNVEIVPAAAGARRSRRDFYVNSRGTLNSFYVEIPGARTTEVQEAPLDELVRPPLDFVKIDVEGAELEVLSGMAGLLAASPGVTLFVEWNPAVLRQAGQAPEALPRTILDLGFAVTVVDRAMTPLTDEGDVRRYLEERLTGTRFTNLLATRRAAERPP